MTRCWCCCSWPKKPTRVQMCWNRSSIRSTRSNCSLPLRSLRGWRFPHNCKMYVILSILTSTINHTWVLFLYQSLLEYCDTAHSLLCTRGMQARDNMTWKHDLCFYVGSLPLVLEYLDFSMSDEDPGCFGWWLVSLELSLKASFQDGDLQVSKRTWSTSIVC